MIPGAHCGPGANGISDIDPLTIRYWPAISRDLNTIENVWVLISVAESANFKQLRRQLLSRFDSGLSRGSQSQRQQYDVTTFLFQFRLRPNG